MREEASFRMFLEKVRTSKRKLEIDDPKASKKRKVSSPYEEGEATVEFVSVVEDRYHQVYISGEILHFKLFRQCKYYFSKRCVKKILVMNFSNIFAF